MIWRMMKGLTGRNADMSGKKVSASGRETSERAVETHVDAIEDVVRRIRSSKVIDNFSESHVLKFDVTDVLRRFKLVRDGFITKKDDDGTRLLTELLKSALMYFEIIDQQRNEMSNRKISSAHLLSLDQERSRLHDAFIDALIALETHLKSGYNQEPLGQGIYPLDKAHLENPKERPKRDYALLKGIKDQA